MTGLPRTRIASCIVLALLAFSPAAAQVFAPPDPLPGASPDPVLLPTDRKTVNQIKAAHEYIAAKDWDNAVRLLQRVLDESKDSLLESEVADAQGNVSVLRTSARAEAERLIAALPKQGLATYRVKVGGTALTALGKARADLSLLEAVVRRYFFTDAGAEALTRMGVAELDRGRIEEAADRFRRLLQRPDVDELPPLTLFQAALAFHAANDAVRENRAVQVLAHHVGPAGLPIGGRALTLDDLRREIARWPATAAASSDWPLFRGDPGRTGRADGDLPLLEARNWADLHVDDEVVRLLTPQAAPAVGPALPGFFPLAVGDKIVYRGPDGLHALEAASGRPIWHSPSPMCLDAVLKDDQKKWQFRRWLEKYRGQPSLLDENATLGTLSSDGRKVFFIEDLPVPPYPQDLTDMQQGLKHWFSTAEENLYHNRLRAVDARTGELCWEVGRWQKPGAPAPPGPAEYDDAFFLGAPLPVGGRLFALTERHQELNLLCINADTGALIWSQNLAATGEDLKYDPARRMQPVHLAYADGVLVCPTNVGAVVALDPLSHNLLWASIYHERKDNPQDGGLPTYSPDAYESQWRGCAPIVHGDRVVLTAPDGGPVCCLNLRDGSRIWTASRSDDDLYVAGVFDDKAGGDKVLIVGRNSCRALNMDKGDEAWARPVVTGTPSGVGAAAGNLYLLPLRNGNVFRIDVGRPYLSTPIEGRPDAALPALGASTAGLLGSPLGQGSLLAASALIPGRAPDAPPGNLIFHDGDLWSQSPTAVTVYRRLDEGLKRAEEKVAGNPRDPAARFDRGRLLYGKGDSARAVEDWLAVLDDNPPGDLAAHTRTRLINALTRLLLDDFTTNERFLGPYDRLCRRPADADADAAPAQVRAYQAEQRRWALNRLALTALGRGRQGRVDLALKAYRDLYETAAPNETMAAPDDPAVRIRPDVWVQERIAALAGAATTPEQRKSFQEQIDQDWRAARSAGDAGPLARFVVLYGTIPGPLGAAGREARLTLAERLLDERDRGLEAELHLRYLREQTDSPDIAARARYDLARLLTRHGLLAEAVDAYRALARDFPAVAFHDGKTAAALLADLANDKRFVAYLDDPFAARPAGRVKVIELPGVNSPQAAEVACEAQDGFPPPANCRNLHLSLDAQTFALKVVSKDGTAEPWSVALPVPASYLHPYLDNAAYAVTYQATDHFLVLSMGPVIVGVDRIERRARWVRGLLPADLAPNATLAPGGADGSVWVQEEDRPNQRLGVVGPVGPDGIPVQTKAGVASLDLLTGDLRWLRAESAPMLDGFGDERRLYLVESHAAGDVRGVRAVRTADGAAVSIPDCVDAYNHKLRTVGRRLLVSEPGSGEEVRLRLYDVRTGQDLWKQTFAAHALVLESSVPELTAVAAPDGTVTVVDLAAAKERVRLNVDPKDLDKATRGMLLRDRTQYYLAFQGSDTAPNVVGDPVPNLNPVERWTPVSGMIYAFDRATGALNWDSKALSQVLLLDHFEESPVLLLSAAIQRQGPGGPGGAQVTGAITTRSIDKRTGKVLYRKELANANNPFGALEIDVRTGTIDLIGGAMKLRHYLDAR